MSKVDWSLAPDWCKGFGLIGISRFEVWFDDHYYEYLHDGKKHKFNDNCTYKRIDISFSEDRSPPKPWSGPEDGLPPVGTRCKVNPSNYGWREAEISYIGNQFIAWLQIGDEEVPENGGWTEFTKFAPIRTPEQLRETAIRELMDIAQVDCRVTAARLVDAGFKREGV